MKISDMHGSNLHPPRSESISNIFPGFFDFLTLSVDDNPIKVLGYRFRRTPFSLVCAIDLPLNNEGFKATLFFVSICLELPLFSVLVLCQHAVEYHWPDHSFRVSGVS